MKKLIYMIAAAAVAIPVVALAQGACGSGSCSKGDKDMAEAKEHRTAGTPLTMRRTGLPIRPKPSVTL